MNETPIDVTIVVPVYNEIANVGPLVEEIFSSLDGLELRHEVLFIDDGSSDGTEEALDELAQKHPTLRAVHFRRNCGQTAALQAGFDLAKGEVIVPMDGDLQNDPADIPKLLAKLNEGYAVVSGWRRDRHDSFSRTFPSRIANWLISVISGVRLHDFGCTMKAYRKEAMEGVRLYGEMHRFIPIYASWQGGKITELVVNHRPRTSGTSKYGIDRTLKVILDLFVIKFLARYSQKPMYVFGSFGFLSICLSFATFALMVYYKFWGGKTFIETPLPLVAVLFFLMGFVSLLLGLLAEIIMRTYYESQGKKTYLIK